MSLAKCCIGWFDNSKKFRYKTGKRDIIFTMKTKDEVIAVLKTVKDQLKAKYKVKALWAFGSLVRGENTALSDIDILVDFDEGADLFSLISLEILLEEKLKQKVDIVPLRALRKEIQENVFKEMITV